MIVDCHTHVWDSLEQLGGSVALWGTRTTGRGTSVVPKAATGDHLAASKPVDKSFVLGFKSHYLHADVPNDFVAGYVRKHSDRLIGFAALDPSRPREAVSDMRRAREQLGMKGVAVWPAAQDFHPASTSAMTVYAEACRFRLPIIFHQSVASCPASKMEFARPYLLDEVAREFPDLKIIISQLGYPWIDETLVLLSKHRNVFADISGLLNNPWQAYNALQAAHQAGVMDALLFGSNFPYTSPAVCIETLYSIHQFCHGTHLPTIPREQLRQIVERNVLELLGIEGESRTLRVADRTLIQADE